MNTEERESLRREIDEHEPAPNFQTLQRQFDELRKIVEQRNAEIVELRAEAQRLNARLAYLQERVEER